MDECVKDISVLLVWYFMLGSNYVCIFPTAFLHHAFKFSSQTSGCQFDDETECFLTHLAHIIVVRITSPIFFSDHMILRSYRIILPVILFCSLHSFFKSGMHIQ
jgi:hypothetical protein